MARKEFPPEVAESMLIKCRRYCCVCGNWCGSKITIHHIEGNDDNSEDNGIPVCFNCHAEIGSYNIDHPVGRKFQPNELKKLRNLTYTQYSPLEQKIPEGNTAYGQGFHDGAIWSERRSVLVDIWRYLSKYGDFALEILIMFDETNTCSMTDEKLWDSRVQSGVSSTQAEGHTDAWHIGQIIGLWDVDGNREVLFLTKRGIIFKELVSSDPRLLARFKQLDNFWINVNREKNNNFIKPETEKFNFDDFPPGYLNWLRVEINKLAYIKGEGKEKYIINSVTPERVELKNIDTGYITTIAERKIRDVEVDHNSAELIITVME